MKIVTRVIKFFEKILISALMFSFIFLAYDTLHYVHNIIQLYLLVLTVFYYIKLIIEEPYSPITTDIAGICNYCNKLQFTDCVHCELCDKCVYQILSLFLGW